MKKKSLFKVLLVVVSLLVIMTTTFQTTFAFVVAKTPPVVNTFMPFKSIVSNLTINKSVEHPFEYSYAIPGNIKFDFKVDLGLEYAGKTFTTTNGSVLADANGSFVVTVKPNIPLEIGGIYEGTNVTVTELPTAYSGFSVKDGISTKQAVITSEKSANIDFINVYNPASVQPVNVNVTGTKVLEGRDWQEGDTFTFVLQQANEYDKWFDIASQTVAYSADAIDFDKFNFNDTIQNMQFSQAGVYAFRILETVGSIDNIKYDQTENYFYITVGDSDMDGSLEIQKVHATDNATATFDDATGIYSVETTFKNTYIPPEEPSTGATTAPTVPTEPSTIAPTTVPTVPTQPTTVAPTAPTGSISPTDSTSSTTPATVDTPTKPSQDKDSPQTGDAKGALILLAILVICTTVWTILLVRSRRNEESKY